MNPSSPEHSDVAAMLEEHRARLTDRERDDIRRRATATRPARRGAALRGRTAITSMLAAGLVMTSGGAALGVSALSETHSAKAAQYGTAAQGVAGLSGSGTAPNSGAGANAGTLAGAGSTGTQPIAAGARGEDGPPAATAQAPRQLESGDSELPFTGYVSGFVLLVGLGTLAAGLTLRRGTTRTPTGA